MLGQFYGQQISTMVFYQMVVWWFADGIGRLNQGEEFSCSVIRCPPDRFNRFFPWIRDALTFGPNYIPLQIVAWFGSDLRCPYGITGKGVSEVLRTSHGSTNSLC